MSLNYAENASGAIAHKIPRSLTVQILPVLGGKNGAKKSMSRKHRFLAGLFAGYSAFGANLLFTLISVPLALHYLPKTEFGLWALVTQIGGYLALLDMGMTSSVARFLADHKDSMGSREYKEILCTGRWVFALQALLLLFFTLASALILPSFLEIPSTLVISFQILLVGQGSIQALGLAFRAESSPLWAHQRIDITHWATTANLLTSLAVMAAGFFFGWGIYSFLAGALMGSLWSWFFPWLACRHLGLLPNSGGGGKFQTPLFLRMVRFGRDVLLMQLGGVICSASPLIIVSKVLGLEAVAVYSVATKALTMGQQLLGRILESAAPGLTELYVRGEKVFFLQSYRRVVVGSAFLSLEMGLLTLTCNRWLVYFWTSHKIVFSVLNDVWLGLLLIATVLSRCFVGYFGMIGDLAKVRLLPFFEGMLFVATAWIGAKIFGLTGVLGAALLSNLATTFLPTLFLLPKEARSGIWHPTVQSKNQRMILLGSLVFVPLFVFAQNSPFASFLLGGAGVVLMLFIFHQASSGPSGSWLGKALADMGLSLGRGRVQERTSDLRPCVHPPQPKAED